MITARYRRQLAVTGILVILLVATIRVVVSGRNDLEIANGCMRAGVEETAIDYFSRAARWYMPFFTTSSDAIEGLIRISEGAGQRQDPETALRALREARSAILASRWILTPHRERLAEINRQIAILMAGDPASENHDSSVAKYLGQLEKTSMPNPIISLFATLLFVCWLAVTIVGSTKVVTARGRFTGGKSWIWIAGSAVLLIGWLVMLLFV